MIHLSSSHWLSFLWWLFFCVAETSSHSVAQLTWNSRSPVWPWIHGTLLALMLGIYVWITMPGNFRFKQNWGKRQVFNKFWSDYSLMGHYLSSASWNWFKSFYCLRGQFGSLEMVVLAKDVLTMGRSVCEVLLYLESKVTHFSGDLQMPLRNLEQDIVKDGSMGQERWLSN